MISPNSLIGVGIVYPLNINSQGTLQLDTGWPIIKSSINNLLAFLVGERYFLGEFGASIEDLLEEPNDDISVAVLQHRLETQLPYWDPRILIQNLSIQRDNSTTVNIVIEVVLKGTDLSELFVIPITVNSVQ